MTSEWLVSPEVAYLDIPHPLLQVLGGKILEGKWALEYPANNGLSAPWQEVTSPPNLLGRIQTTGQERRSPL